MKHCIDGKARFTPKWPLWPGRVGHIQVLHVFFSILYSISSDFFDLSDMTDEYIELSVIKYSTIINIFISTGWTLMMEYILIDMIPSAL